MRRTWRRFLWSAFLAAASTPASEAQQAPAIEQLDVALWPEYDRPGEVLVLYRFRLKEGTVLPATVRVPIPAAAGEPHAVAWKSSQGGLMLAQYMRVVEGAVAWVDVTMQGLEGQLELYVPLTRDGPERRFRFVWPGGIVAGALTFEVQRPRGATGFETTPPSKRSAVGGDGLTYAWIDVGPLAASSKPAIELRYEKEGSGVSADALPPQASSSTSTSSVPARTAAEGGARGLLYAAAGLLLGAGAVLLWWTSRKPRPAAPAAPPAGAPKFCPECGTKTEPGASYCIACGTRLRR